MRRGYSLLLLMIPFVFFILLQSSFAATEEDPGATEVAEPGIEADYANLIGEYEQTGFEVYGPKGVRVVDQDSRIIPDVWNGQMFVFEDGVVYGSMFIEDMLDAEVIFQILEVDGNSLYVSSPYCETEADWVEVTQTEEEYILTFSEDFCLEVKPDNCCGWTNLIYKKK